MPEGAPKIVGLSYAMKVYDNLAKINWRNPLNEIRVGGNDFHGNYPLYSDFWESLNFNTIEADISRHDARASEKSMVAAFSLLRSCYPDGDDIDNHFLYFMSGTIFKNIVTPGRFCYKVLKGIPSGSPFTSILVSLVNWLNWSGYITLKDPFNVLNYHLNVFGDDTLLNIPDSFDSDIGKFSSGFTKFCGQVLSPCEIRSWHALKKEMKPSFLKTISNYSLPCRLLRDTMRSACIIRKSNGSDMRYSEVITGLCYASPFDWDGLEYLFAFRTWLVKRHERVSNLTAGSISNAKARERADRITQTVMFRNYLLPLLFSIEKTKNVDLGNKPKVNQLGYNMPEWMISDRCLRVLI